MDPLSILGLTASIVQLVDFSTRVLNHWTKLFRQDSTLTYHHINIVTEDFEKLMSSLKRQIDDARIVGGHLDPDEQELLKLANECDKVVQELLKGARDGIEKANIPRLGHEKTSQEVKKGQVQGSWAPPRNVLKSLRAALALAWGSKRVDELQDQLNGYRGEILSRLLVVMNKTQRKQTKDMEQMKRSNQEIVEILSVECNTLHLQLQRQHRQYTKLAGMDRQAAEKRHAEVIAAILTSRDGESRMITSRQPGGNLLRDSVNLGYSFTTRTYRQDRDPKSTDRHNQIVSATTDLASITNEILNALEFREMYERTSTISTAYDSTLEWIFSKDYDGDGEAKQSTNFAEWLTHGTGCYWVNGKAGSGKSTLMKRIVSHPSTSLFLTQWARSHPLFIASFFFWYAGTPLQKSQHGLLRALLFTILRNRRELIPVLFPNVTRALLCGQQQLPLQLTSCELKRAFSAMLMDTGLIRFKVCLIIDGLDEYDGNADELAKLFLKATTSKHVKMILSSRPIPDCVNAFKSCPQMRLQDLTRHDIYHFAMTELSSDYLMNKLEHDQRGATVELVEGIVSKASGVFLWVSVVVKLLLKGLRDYDTLADLKCRLEELPDELECLYSHMLWQMPKRHRNQGSKFLQLVLKSSRTQGSFPMTLLQLSFAEHEEYDRCFSANYKGLEVCEDEAYRLEAVEGRLRSRCCGLIEVQGHPDLGRHQGNNNVSFLHRTVSEFLEDPVNWNEVTSWTCDPGFCASSALLSSSLSELKARLWSQNEDTTDSPAFRAAARIMTYEDTLSHADDDCAVRHKFRWKDVVPEMTRTLYKFWGEKGGGCRSNLVVSIRESLLVTAGFHCSEAQITPLLDILDGSAAGTKGTYCSRAKVQAILLSHYVDEQASLVTRNNIAVGIMGCHGNPNEPISFHHNARRYWEYRFFTSNEGCVSQWTPWEFLLQYIYHIMSHNFEFLVKTGLVNTVFDLIISLLGDGATRSASISTSNRVGINRASLHSNIVYANELIYLFCYRVWREKETLGLFPTRSNSIGSEAAVGFAEKCRRIETLFTSQAIDRTCTPSRPDMGLSKKACLPIESKLQRPKGESPHWPKVHWALLPIALDQASHAHANVWAGERPWVDYLLGGFDPAADGSSPGINAARTSKQAKKLNEQAETKKEKGEEIQKEKNWTFTRRRDRINLLSPSDQELVRALVGSSKSKYLSRLMSRTPQEQERIIDCVNALRDAIAQV
ncbi:hypothetical protein F5Y12DRAFT_688017 [Xylaria sp. FL1777]|nr:hypothetical protein F5Y12DRAFT_688017 [Xylaria sp. FL1777]